MVEVMAFHWVDWWAEQKDETLVALTAVWTAVQKVEVKALTMAGSSAVVMADMMAALMEPLLAVRLAAHWDFYLIEKLAEMLVALLAYELVVQWAFATAGATDQMMVEPKAASWGQGLVVGMAKLWAVQLDLTKVGWRAELKAPL
jgi:hypothetical protein